MIRNDLFRRRKSLYSVFEKKKKFPGPAEKKEGEGAVHSKKFQGHTQRTVPARLTPRAPGGRVGDSERWAPTDDQGPEGGSRHGGSQQDTQHTQKTKNSTNKRAGTLLASRREKVSVHSIGEVRSPSQVIPRKTRRSPPDQTTRLPPGGESGLREGGVHSRRTRKSSEEQFRVWDSLD